MKQLWFLLFLFLIDLQTSFGATAYGTYGLFPQGSTRVLGMGGAIVGLADDASSLNFNPAGLAMARFKYDFQTSDNRVVNKELITGSATAKVGVPYFINTYSAAFKFGNLAFGGGYSIPYNLETKESIFVLISDIDPPDIRIESFDTFIAYKFTNYLSLGVTLHAERAAMSYKKQSLSATLLESSADQVFPTLGLSFKSTSRSGVGIAYTPGRRYEFTDNDTYNSSIQTATGLPNVIFRDVAIPGKLTIGGNLRVGRTNWVVDVDYYEPVKDAVYVNDQSSLTNQKIEEKQQSVLHGGYEIYIIKNRKMDFIWRGGGYREPPRFRSNKDRLHFTMGIEFRWGPIAVAAAYDQSEDFTNTANSISVSIDAL